MRRPSPNKRKKIVLGVTGSFGSGKSTVSGFLRAFGAEVIDADKLARECVLPGKPAYKKIAKVFGKGILVKNKGIDRGKLAAVVFNNKKLLKELNAIIHPEVIRRIKERIRGSSAKAVVLDVPLLIESGLEKLTDKIIVVRISRAAQIKRLRAKTGLPPEDILKRIRSQISQEAKLRFADFIIDNSGTTGETKKQAAGVWRSIVPCNQ